VRVSGGETPPFRPPIPLNDLTNDAQLLQLMRDCWDEFSTTRPDFSTIRRRFVLINKGKYDAALPNKLTSILICLVCSLLVAGRYSLTSLNVTVTHYLVKV